jgi:hypothetical protein
MTGTDTVAGAGIPGLSARRLTAPGLVSSSWKHANAPQARLFSQGTRHGGALDPGATWLWIPRAGTARLISELSIPTHEHPPHKRVHHHAQYSMRTKLT